MAERAIMSRHKTLGARVQEDKNTEGAILMEGQIFIRIVWVASRDPTAEEQDIMVRLHGCLPLEKVNSEDMTIEGFIELLRRKSRSLVYADFDNADYYAVALSKGLPFCVFDYGSSSGSDRPEVQNVYFVRSNNLMTLWNRQKYLADRRGYCFGHVLPLADVRLPGGDSC